VKAAYKQVEGGFLELRLAFVLGQATQNDWVERCGLQVRFARFKNFFEPGVEQHFASLYAQ